MSLPVTEGIETDPRLLALRSATLEGRMSLPVTEGIETGSGVLGDHWCLRGYRMSLPVTEGIETKTRTYPKAARILCRMSLPEPSMLN